MVVPEQISDSDMVLLARDISKQIESELEYPGQIKVNVIRESRVIDYAKWFCIVEKYKEIIENVMFSILSFCVDNKPGSLQFSSFPRLHWKKYKIDKKNLVWENML